MNFLEKRILPRRDSPATERASWEGREKANEVDPGEFLD